MPGFGTGSFGGDPFGEFNWSKRVLYDFAPILYRESDTDRLFELYTRAQGEAFTDLRKQIRDFFDLRDPRAVRTQFDESVLLLLGEIQVVKEPVEHSGIRGQVSAGGVFSVERGRFTFGDLGKELTVLNSVSPVNNISVRITSIVSAKSVLTNPPLQTDAGPLRWEVRPVSASTFSETLVEVVAGDVEPIGPGWVLTDGAAEFVVSGRKQFFPASEERKLLTDREGSDGSVSGGYLVSPTANFQQVDVGKRITISGSTALPPSIEQNNNGKFSIVEVISTSQVLTDALLYDDTGPLDWAVLRRPQLRLEGTSTLQGIVSRVGSDMTTIAPDILESPSGGFDLTDVGKLVTIYADNDVNNGVIFEVLEVPGTTQVRVDPAPTVTAATYRYEFRTPTTIGDTRQVQVRAPGLIRFLAQDFGIEVDTREEEEFQRRWVESVSRWIGLKGVEKGYQYLAALTGYSPTTVEALYRVSQEIYEAIGDAGGTQYAVGESFGSDGSLTLVGGLVQFSSPSASFTVSDLGRVINVSNTSGGTNDGLRTIDEIVSSTSVKFRGTDTMTGTADANNGAIEWQVVRLYSSQAPLIPVFDEINADRMEYLKGASVFAIDKYCWEQLPSPWSTLVGDADGLIEITGSSPSAASVFPLTYVVTGKGDFDVVAGLGVGRWRLDNQGTLFFLETVPEFPRVRTAAALSSSFPTGSKIEDVELEFDTSVAPFTVGFQAGVGLGVLDNVQAGDLLVTGPSVAFPGTPPAALLNGWVIDTVAADGTSFELDASYTTASTGLPSDTFNVTGTIFRVFRPGGTVHSGVDASLTNSGPSRVTVGSVGFSSDDVGRRMFIFQSGSGNNGTWILDSFVDASNIDLDATDTPTTPDVNNGNLTWAMMEFEFSVIATQPPTSDPSTLEYICSEQLNCDYCKSYKVRIETTTPYVLEGGVMRLQDRIAQATPKHVEVVEAYGTSPLATLGFSASGSSTFP